MACAGAGEEGVLEWPPACAAHRAPGNAHQPGRLGWSRGECALGARDGGSVSKPMQMSKHMVSLRSQGWLTIAIHGGLHQSTTLELI